MVAGIGGATKIGIGCDESVRTKINHAAKRSTKKF